ncbi:hypothetical protein [Deinococcus wulumuqiensis]|uniref:Uncharacterized protein n=2 Tax=Deinococcus wulumuqiensis TaxID=980427 RepID=A0AAV4K694_9DEIO|nr:hypothetical protein [Deinococcus wulumuqiensis]QII21470.1 hypothetical protein G6R31_12595 [Deinococcus wulumuqiensis R12]GGI84928.1 hypothetical protein GCM10010914_19140 [Deinococcus wulumuqiensis]GGP29903.1 hypothetical protein GCM10008021_15540 [Deinococcus wulumuqiensis]
MPPLQFPLTLEFKFSLFTELQVHDAAGQMLAYVREKTFSVRDEVKVYTDPSRQRQTHGMKAEGFMAGALDWRAKRVIRRSDGTVLGALQAQGMRTLWAAGYELLGPGGEVRLTIRDDQPWMSFVEGAVGAVPFIGDFVAMGFDYLINPTYTVSDAGGSPVYRVHKKRSFFSRRFTVQELRPRPADSHATDDDELVLLGLIQLVLRERERG